MLRRTLIKTYMFVYGRKMTMFGIKIEIFFSSSLEDVVLIFTAQDKTVGTGSELTNLSFAAIFSVWLRKTVCV